MLPSEPDNGLISDLYHIGKRGSFEARKRGQDDALFKFVAGTALIWIGGTMALNAWNKLHGGKGR